MSRSFTLFMIGAVLFALYGMTHKREEQAEDLNDCSISKDKGAAELSTVWTDPTFKAD